MSQRMVMFTSVLDCKDSRRSLDTLGGPVLLRVARLAKLMRLLPSWTAEIERRCAMF